MMSPIRVLTFADYLTSGSYTKDEHYAACQFVKCLKGESFKGYARIPTSGSIVRLNPGDRTLAIETFAKLVKEYDVFENPTLLVPIPSSKTHIGSPTQSPMFDLATAIQNLYKDPKLVNAKDILCWDRPLPSAHHQGGPRHPEELFPHLRLRPRAMCGSQIVLVDDVKTSGGHIQACAALLEQHFPIHVVGAICLGRTVEVPSEKSLAWDEHLLNRYTPR